MFKINNTDPVTDHQLRLLGGGWSMFRRVRVLCGGQILEDIDNYCRIHEMFHIMTNPVNRKNDAAEGTQNQYDIIRNASPPTMVLC